MFHLSDRANNDQTNRPLKFLDLQLALTIGRYHPTVKLSYEYASVNALAQVLSDEYRGSFSNFVRNNIDEDEDSLLNFIHERVRSAHWHGGEFALGEIDYRKDYLTNIGARK